MTCLRSPRRSRNSGRTWKTQHALVAVDGQRIVGIVRAAERDGVWHIGRLGVVPDRQCEGIGRELLQAIEVAAPAHVHTFALFTGPKSLGNVAFYERPATGASTRATT